jgi:hypothetical protein
VDDSTRNDTQELELVRLAVTVTVTVTVRRSFAAVPHWQLPRVVVMMIDDHDDHHDSDASDHDRTLNLHMISDKLHRDPWQRHGHESPAPGPWPGPPGGRRTQPGSSVQR